MLDVRCTTDTRKIVRLDYQPLFGKGARAGRPHARERQNIEPTQSYGKKFDFTEIKFDAPGVKITFHLPFFAFFEAFFNKGHFFIRENHRHLCNYD